MYLFSHCDLNLLTPYFPSFRDWVVVFRSRKLCTAAIVAVGCSSISQWPEFAIMTSVTLSAALRMMMATFAPNDFAPPIASTGIVSLVVIKLCYLQHPWELRGTGQKRNAWHPVAHKTQCNGLWFLRRFSTDHPQTRSKNDQDKCVRGQPPTVPQRDRRKRNARAQGYARFRPMVECPEPAHPSLPAGRCYLGNGRHRHMQP